MWLQRDSVLGRSQIPQRRVTPPVVVDFEVADHDSGFEKARPVVAGQALVAQPAVERLDIAVVPGGRAGCI